MYNSAYFEHKFLAQQMGVQLVEGRTWPFRTRKCHAHDSGTSQSGRSIGAPTTTSLDPLAFGKDSLLGVPGLLDAYRAGTVAQRTRSATESRTTKSSTPTFPT
jgi:uncharacterized circularly permuted ATP-grasp superfamily protein